MVRVKDRKTMMPISFVNTHITGGPNRTVGDKQVEEIVHLLQKYTYAVVAGDFNGTVKDVRMVKFADYGIIHDSVMSLTNSSKSRKLDHILYKGSGRSMFIAESCHVDAGIKGSDHYPLTCRVFLQ